jgi:hypothetical protein
MIRIPTGAVRFATLAAGSAVLVTAFALTASGAYGPQPQDARGLALAEYREIVASTPAALMFPDAPDGVDSMVTGPVSAEFRARQQAAGCEAAEWPNVPVACYPD